jgi:hypothetical protein
LRFAWRLKYKTGFLVLVVLFGTEILKMTGTRIRIFRLTLCILYGVLFFIPELFSQNNSDEKDIINAFNQYRSRYIQEKLFVHTDKDSYVSREIIWFRIYYVDAFYNRPASISKIAYIEILDKYNRPVLQQKVSLKPGESNGTFIIPVSIPSGIYRLRAYTNWMKNFSADYYFQKNIRIINPRNLKPDSVVSKIKGYDIQFFPEGGNLVQNIETRVAFRITNAYGKGLDCEGILLNSGADTILKFHPLNLGLGNFQFAPVAGQSYTAVIRFPNGEKINKELPTSYRNGYVMNLSKTSDGEIAIKIKSSADLGEQVYYLFIHGSHSFLPVTTGKLYNSQSSVLIDPKNLEDGISQITLFNNAAKPVCERLYFKFPENKLLISATTNPEYGNREKIDLNLTIKDQSGNPADADMSLAVYRLDSLQNADETDIRNYLYLTAELGPVESPAFYFTNNGVSREEDMNNLMMTHGWRRFLWNDMLEQKPLSLKFAPEYNGHIIQGRLTDNNTGSPVSDISVYLSIPSTRAQFRVTTTTASGLFKFEMPGFYGSQELILQTNPDEDSTCHAEIFNPFSESYSANPTREYAVSSYYSSILDQSIAEQVQHIYNGISLNQFSRQVVDTNTFYVEPDEKYILDNYTRFQTMEEVIREYVVSTNVSMKNNKFRLQLVDKPEGGFFKYSPLILIDGVPFFDANELFQQDPLKIKRLDLVNRQYSLGFKYFDGIVNATTYNGDLNGIQMNIHANVFDYPGIPEQREFFSPVYETEDQVNSPVPDFRTLLYWSPEIKSAFQNNKPISFYSSDLPGNYVINIMGITKNGDPGNQLIFFKVKSKK